MSSENPNASDTPEFRLVLDAGKHGQRLQTAKTDTNRLDAKAGYEQGAGRAFFLPSDLPGVLLRIATMFLSGGTISSLFFLFPTVEVYALIGLILISSIAAAAAAWNLNTLLKVHISVHWVSFIGGALYTILI